MTFVEGWRVAGVLVHVVPRRNIYAVAIVIGQGFSLRDNETWAIGFKMWSKAVSVVRLSGIFHINRQ